jgi:hypothetical protein
VRYDVTIAAAAVRGVVGDPGTLTTVLGATDEGRKSRRIRGYDVGRPGHSRRTGLGLVSTPDDEDSDSSDNKIISIHYGDTLNI